MDKKKATRAKAAETRTEGPDLAEVRERLEAGGQGYWKSLEQVADTPEFQKWVDDEFPNRSTLMQVDRRDFLKFMGASMALAGLGGCRSLMLDKEKVVPYVQQPEDLVPGRPVYYRTAMPRPGGAIGLEVKSYEGRPMKVEGNPDHPASLGSVDSFALASILTLYDPDRSQNVAFKGEIDTWQHYVDALQKAIKEGRPGSFRILSESVNSPTLERQVGQIARVFPGMKWHQWEPINRDSVYEGAHMVLGRDVQTVYDLSRAKVILSIDADFVVSEMPGGMRYARQMMDGRRVEKNGDKMNRIYAVNTMPTLNGAVADHSRPMNLAQIHELLSAMISGGGDAFAQAVRSDLQANPGAAVIVVGDHMPAWAHAMAHVLNKRIGAGDLVQYVDPPGVAMRNGGSLGDLVADIDAGKVKTLLVLGSNPIYNAPAGAGFTKELLAKVHNRFHHGMYIDETGALCDWHAPESHFLESWGDTRAFDGTASIIQPLIMPIHEGRSQHMLLSLLMGKAQKPRDIVRDTWRGQLPDEKAWRSAVHDGIVPNTRRHALNIAVPDTTSIPEPKLGGFEIHFRTDPTIGDGRWANNGWLQELPKPLTKVTWDNAVHISPKTAQAMGVRNGDHVRVSVGSNSVTGPIWILPGHADESATIHLGYGRWEAGRVATDHLGHPWGFNAYKVQPAGEWIASGSLTKVDGATLFSVTQDHNSMEGRDIVRAGTLAEYAQNPNFQPKEHHEASEKTTLYNKTAEWAKENPDLAQWGMSIDLNTCIGCNACVTACQAENNIPVVGKEQVMRGREMHWIRIDRYYGPRGGKGDLDNPQTYFQPLTCMHCETAPCEPVCPVAATVHSHEGLNQMIYNRCVGTRYCSNNCPYKVRRFNYLNYQFQQPNFWKARSEEDIPLLRMINNPEVTVRSRGVMEKCTYCVQRINAARVEAKKDNRPIKDGEVVTACQQACPTRAIVFGNIADEKSEVRALRDNARRYVVLGDLNTFPRTTYLGKIRNPNPMLEGADG